MSVSIAIVWMLVAGVLLMFPASSAAADPPSTLTRIKQFNPWLSPDDPLELPLKLNSLLQDEYTFFRGTADLYYDWCKVQCPDWLGTAGDFITLHGDIHLGNIGTYPAWTANGRVNRFGIVDLDETFHGPYQIELLRGILSLRLAASNNRIDLSKSDRIKLIDRFLEGYAGGLNGKIAAGDLANRHEIVKSLLKEADAGDPAELVDKFCEGRPPRRFRSARLKKGKVSDIMTPVDEKTRAAIIGAVNTYFESADGRAALNRWLGDSHQSNKPEIADIARWSRIGSGGSQGVRKYLVLIVAPNTKAIPPLMLQLKEEPVPSAERAGLVKCAPGPKRAAEVSAAYAAMLDDPLWLVGHVAVDGRGYLIRTKDPFSEEPSSGDYKTRDAILDGAALLGETLGQSHRAAIRRQPTGDAKIGSIIAALPTLRPVLLDRTDSALSRLHRTYIDLQQDPIAQKMVKAAKQRIEAAAAERRD